ncbi:MAG: cell division protein ZapA [Bacteroidia bacterium]|nr:MAG: cell division protein ZapA [Bacteroidia bacterium]
MDEKLSIRINVADRFYPLKVNREEEEDIRKAARIINEKVLQYKQKYTDKDAQDFLAMAALQFVNQLIELQEKEETDDLSESLREISDSIATLLEK